MASGRKLINSSDEVVTETLKGLCYAYPHLEYHASKGVVLTPEWRERSGKVAIVTGGGSGHEPHAAGFVGSGLLTASVAGNIFAAPSSNHILHALHCVSFNNKAGILVVVPNYTGDCLNFGIAIEKARNAGLTVAELTVGEDCSIPTSEQGRAGKRGLVGMLFVIKVAAALAERGQPLSEVATWAELVANNIATYGVGLSACALPGQRVVYKIPEDELEIGLGVHAEAGYKRIKMRSASEITSIMLEQIIKTLSLVNGDFVAVIINNFGGCSQLEQGIMVNEVVTQLQNRGMKPLRVYAGVLMTSLESAGIHVSILRLAEHYKNVLLSCLDEITSAPCWPGSSYSEPLLQTREPFQEDKRKKVVKVGPILDEYGGNVLRKCLANACLAIIENEERINELDRGCGDGDCGATLRLLAEGILSSLDSLPLSYPSSLLSELSAIAEERMGGTSGAIYCLMFTTAAAELALASEGEKWEHTWAHAWRGGIEGIMRYSKAKLGDRTMLDVLDPACKEFEVNLSRSYKDALIKVAETARLSCEATKNMEPKPGKCTQKRDGSVILIFEASSVLGRGQTMESFYTEENAAAGRASYVKQTIYLQDVDAGAFAVSTWINAIASTIIDLQN